MPIITATIGATHSRERSAAIAAMLGKATAEILGKDPKVTAIAISHVAPEDWYVGGRSLAEHGKASFALEIKVTDETNSKDEKARYIAAVFSGFAGILGDIHEESYVHVHDVRAAAYGYGGRTQEYRYQHR